MRSVLYKKMVIFMICPFILFVSPKIFSSDFLQSPDSFQMTGGLSAELLESNGSNSFSFSPVFSFFMGKVSTGEFPVAEADFLNQTGSVSLQTQIFADLKQRSIDESTNYMDNTTVGYDVTVRWVWDKLPLTVTFPFTEKRIRWKDNDETMAILHYHTMAGEIGYYIARNTEISAGFGYLQPDLFYKENSGTSVYSYLAWDISIFKLDGKTVLNFPGRSWISLEPSFLLLKDQENNKLTGGGFSAVYYPFQTLGIGFSCSVSSFSGGSNYWNVFLEVMGATEFGAEMDVCLFPWLDLQGYFGRIIPQKDGYDSISVVRINAFLRI